jgi:4-aminobutyrate aminotransferase/4-aminobutyrate aminotransferase/(S)-3-amino-2-methylpropionate transaminase
MSAGWPHTHDQFHRLMPQFVRVPQPYPYRAPAGLSSEDIALQYADLLKDTIRRGVNGRPSAVLMEPIQGNGGHVEFPRLYYKLVRQICDEEGLLLIWDEIQTGLGRLGAWWASDLYDVVPDILIFGKGVAGGYPLAGVLVREELAGFETGDDALTFGQFPVSLAAGLATLDVLENEGLIDAAREMGTYLTGRLLEMQDRHPLMGDVRCPGLFTAVELVKDRETKEPALKEAEQVYDLGLRHGVMFGTSRYAGLGNVVKIKPPLTINRADMDQVIDVFDRVLTEIEGSSL